MPVIIPPGIDSLEIIRDINKVRMFSGMIFIIGVAGGTGNPLDV